MVELQFYKLRIIIIVILIMRKRIDWLINSVDMLQSEIKIVELQFHKLQRIIIIYFDCDNTLTDQLHVTVRLYASVCASYTFVVTVNKTNCWINYYTICWLEYSLSIVLLIAALCY